VCPQPQQRSSFPDPLTTGIERDNRVEDERKHATVPGHVDEPDQATSTSSAHPAEAVAMHLAVPVIFQNPMAERLGMQGVQLGVGEASTPVIFDGHADDSNPIGTADRTRGWLAEWL
jgi:hypothetical protein